MIEVGDTGVDEHGALASMWYGDREAVPAESRQLLEQRDLQTRVDEQLPGSHPCGTTPMIAILIAVWIAGILHGQ